MRKATLTREERGDAGTFGTILTDTGRRWRTGELPWRWNIPGESCIYPDVYVVTWRFSPKHGLCYHVEGVAGRSDVEIHGANLMGDTAIVNPATGKPFEAQLLGCIAPGKSVGILNGQRAVLSSQSALEELQDELGRETFELTILDPLLTGKKA